MPLGEAGHVQPAVAWRGRIEPPSPCEHCEARRGPAGIGVGSGAPGWARAGRPIRPTRTHRRRPGLLPRKSLEAPPRRGSTTADSESASAAVRVGRG